MPIFCNMFKEEPGTALFEECQAGDKSLPVRLGEEDAKVVLSLLSYSSFSVSKALAAVYCAGLQAGARDRCRPVRTS